MTPRLRLLPGMTTQQAIDEATAEHIAIEHEARQHVAHLRLLAQQLPLWPADVAQRVLLREAAKYERKFDTLDAA